MHMELHMNVEWILLIHSDTSGTGMVIKDLWIVHMALHAVGYIVIFHKFFSASYVYGTV